ncbi:MAG: PAS domain-containing protein [Alphaproteobacteria bacterium]|nr:PAS domain-containing protein [Alphaproteobacteria bacterium]
MTSGADDADAAALRGRLQALFQAEGSPPPEVVPAPTAEVFDDPRLQFHLAYWRALGGAVGAPPPAGALPSLDLSAGLGHVNLIERVGADDFLYRVYGVRVSEAAGQDLTGVILSAAKMPEAQRALFAGSYRLAAATAAPVLTVHAAPAWARVQTWRRLVTPLADDDGVCRRFLVGLVAQGGGAHPRPPPPAADALMHYDGPADRGAGLAEPLPPAEGMPFRNIDFRVLSGDAVAPERFGLAAHQVLAGFWRAARIEAGGDLPLTRSIDPLAFRQALGSVLLLEPVDGGRDYLYRLYGTQVARFFGRDMTGRRLWEFPSPAVTNSLVQYRMVTTNRVALYVEHDAPDSVSVLVRWCRLILPFQDESGAIDRLLVGNVAVPRAKGGDAF